jgi:hypothetical protein
MKKYSPLIILALLATVAHADYTWKGSWGMADNTAWSATGKCLTSIGGITVEAKAGVDGKIYGLAGNTLFTYTHASG